MGRSKGKEIRNSSSPCYRPLLDIFSKGCKKLLEPIKYKHFILVLSICIDIAQI
jgi:hypothetical protein